MSFLRISSLRQLTIPDDAVVIADQALGSDLLGELAVDSARAPLLVEAGEGLKTLGSLEALAGRVLRRRATKPMTLIAIGGGSVGDAVGFLASILWRGVDLWHVPTTLLAMVDSAHGGKTAVNLGAAKNQLGTFYPAQKVILVDQFLATLPFEQRQDGLFELIKGLWLGDAHALDVWDADGGVQALGFSEFDDISERLGALIERAVAVKEAIVARDPFETNGIRTVLNLGHTVAHALELICGLSHGQAVGWGLLAAAELSAQHAGLPQADADRMRGQISPLLRYNPALASLVETRNSTRFEQVLGRDKKRADGELRSVLLSAAGQPIVTREITASAWFAALCQEFEGWVERPFRVVMPAANVRRTDDLDAPTLEIEASKSELNRAQIIASLHPFGVQIGGESSAADVRYLAAALEEIGGANPEDELAIYCGEGGTTLRFLLARVACRPGVTRLYAHPRLLARPHAPLIEALRRAGSSVEEMADEVGVGFRVRGWRDFPEKLTIAGHTSSQYASALAMLAAAGEPLRLEIDGEGRADRDIVSKPYFEMTLEMLRRVGLQVESISVPASEGRQEISMRPGPAFARPQMLTADADASSAAVWAVARFLGIPVNIKTTDRPSLQPDARIDAVLKALTLAATTGGEPIVLDMQESPDLVPVVVVAALSVPPAVQIRGVAHLRHKESNRIEDLVKAASMAAIELNPLEDGISIPAGIQRAQNGARIATFGDHRLAMAALLLTANGREVLIEDPWVVAKSYPNLWRDARALGWRVR